MKDFTVNDVPGVVTRDATSGIVIPLIFLLIPTFRVSANLTCLSIGVVPYDSGPALSYGL